MSAERTWERVTPDTYRLAVPGGWLYAVDWSCGEGQSVVFVPTPNVDPYFYGSPNSADLVRFPLQPNGGVVPVHNGLPGIVAHPELTARQTAQAAFAGPSTQTLANGHTQISEWPFPVSDRLHGAASQAAAIGPQ